MVVIAGTRDNPPCSGCLDAGVALSRQIIVLRISCMASNDAFGTSTAQESVVPEREAHFCPDSRCAGKMYLWLQRSTMGMPALSVKPQHAQRPHSLAGPSTRALHECACLKAEALERGSSYFLPKRSRLIFHPCTYLKRAIGYRQGTQTAGLTSW